MPVIARKLDHHENGGEPKPRRRAGQRGRARRNIRADRRPPRLPEEEKHNARQESISQSRVLWRQASTALLLVFLMALGVVILHGMIISRGYELAQIKEDLERLEAETAMIESQVLSLKSPGRIERVATGELGLVYPKAGNTINISPEMEDGDALTDVVASSGDEVHSATTGSRGSADDEVVLTMESERETDVQVASMWNLAERLLRWLRGDTSPDPGG